MTFDSLPHERSVSRDLQPATDFEINPQAPRTQGSGNAGKQTPLTEAEHTLRSALQATMANGGIPNEKTMDLFREAMTQSETAIQKTAQTLQQNGEVANKYIDSDRKVASIVEQLDPHQRKNFSADVTAYLQDLVPKDKMEKAMSKTYAEFPELVPALQARYAADHAPNGAFVRGLLGSRGQLLEDRLLTAKLYSSALDAEANHHRLGDPRIMEKPGK